MTAIVDMQNVSFSYGGPAVIEDVTFSVTQGEFVALIGPNGGGKTTLLKLMLGLLKPQKGTIQVLGLRPEKASCHIGYVPQDIHLNLDFPITALDVVLMGKLAPGKRWVGRPAAHRSEAMAALEQMGMAGHAGSRIGGLSGGQRQRVFIARALVTRPRLLLLDEPTASIDTKGQADFFDLLHHLNQQVTIVMVSHDLLAVSRHVNSVACVNRGLHAHRSAQPGGIMNDTPCPSCAVEAVCPVCMAARGGLSPFIKIRKT
ncbi:MAG: metal ABC transporter ATP-binding protein [Thermodesulfobacteriota bacterium]